MKNKNGCISIGRCNKNFCFIIFGAIIIQLCIILFVYFIDYYSDNNGIDPSNYLNIISFLFFINICESLMIVPQLILNKNTSKQNIESNITPNTNLYIEYIYNQNSITFSMKEKIYFWSAGLLKLLLNFTYILYLISIDEDHDNFVRALTFSFEFELLFLFLLSKIIYKIQFYKHQYLSIIVITLTGIAKFIMENLNKGYKKIFLYLIFHLVYSFFQSMLTIYIKGLMKFKYISPYKSCYIYGLVNFIFIAIIYIIVSFFPCEKDGFFCPVKYKGNYYSAQILTIFNIPGLFLFIIFLLKAILLVLNYIIIDKFSVCHSFFLIQFGFIVNFKPLNELKKEKNNIIISLVFFCVNIFFILLFLELIELNICKISYNSKFNIENRAISENELITMNNVEDNCEDNEEEVEEENQNNKNNNS